MEQKEIVYEERGDLASFPFYFVFYKTEVDDEYLGVSTSYLYKDIEVNEEEKNTILSQLKELPTQIDSEFTIQDGQVIYVTKGIYKGKMEGHRSTIDIRRHFIEDYLEVEDEIRDIVSPFHATTLKTEFLNGF